MKHLMTLSLLALVLVIRPSAVRAEATPAVPGGGNPHNDNPNAATPAVPADGADVEHMDDRDAGDLLEAHPDLRDQAKARWDAMTPEERQAFLRDHPKLGRRMLKRKWDEMSPRDRAQFCRTHPELRERLADRWRSMTPEQRQVFIAHHPRVARAVRRHERREHRDNGVRDHGAGEGRDGHGQGGEHRRK